MQPNFAPAWCGLAAASAASGCTTDSVLACFREAARIDPECADAYVGMGSCAKEMRQMEQAEAHFATAVRLRPGDARLHAHLAGILYERQRLLEALHSYIAALQLEPTLCDAMNDMGNTYRGLGRLDDAYRCYAACLSQHAAAGTTSKAAVAVTYSNMGAILKLQGRSEEAIGCFDSAVRLVPDSADAQAALGGALKDAGQHEQALAYYRVALAMPPARSSGAPQLQQHATRAQFVHSLASVCAWDEFSTALPALREETRALLAAGQPSAVQPFHAVRSFRRSSEAARFAMNGGRLYALVASQMAYDLDAQLVLDLTRAYAAQVLASAKCLGVPAFAHPPAELSSPARRLRVGFVSSDIGQHPLSHLMGSVFGLMDRSCIEVRTAAPSTCYSPPHDDACRRFSCMHSHSRTVAHTARASRRIRSTLSLPRR
jgi:protein O-GlcNAc transferase